MERELDAALLARIDALPDAIAPDWKGALRLIFSGVRQAEMFRTPGMPLYWQWSHRKKHDPVFAELAAEAAAVLGRKGSRMPREVADAVVQAFAEGATSPRAASRVLGGKPSDTAIRELYAGDAAFRARVESYWKPAASTRSRYAAADYERAVEAVEAGAPIAGLSSLGLPSATTLRTRSHRDGALRRRLDAVQSAKAEARSAIYESALVHLEAGVAGTALPDLGLPSLDTLHKYRRRHEALSERVEAVLRPRWAPSYRPADLNRALLAIEGGSTIRGLRKAGLPGKTFMARLRRTDGAFAARLTLAQRRRSERTGADAFSAPLSLSQHEVWATVNAAVSSVLPAFVRDDVISEMVADVLEGHLALANIRGAARGYVSEHFRQSGGQRMLSLDADVYGDGGRTLHDLLAS